MSEEWLRRQAVQITAQLPDNPDDALQVLELAKTLVNDFLRPQEARERFPEGVLAFPASAASSSR